MKDYKIKKAADAPEKAPKEKKSKGKDE